MENATLTTPLGTLLIEADEIGICQISYSTKNDEYQEEHSPLLKEGIRQLMAYFKDELKIFDVPLHPRGTDFQQKVWKALGDIPYGKTRSYKQQATSLGDVNAIRAVASANGKNPIPIIIPCHRVIGSDGSLTGYAGGLWRKKWLLKHENVLRQQSLF